VKYTSSDPEIIGANADLLRMCIDDSSWQMVEELTENWAPEFKTAVWRILTQKERLAIKNLKLAANRNFQPNK
jgi:hypothetical protein